MEKQDPKQKNDVSIDSVAFESVDAFAWRNDDYDVESNGLETVYPNTGVKLQRRIEQGRDGKSYQNFAIAFATELNGRSVVQTAYFNPVSRNTPMFELLAAMFGDSEYYPAEIVKTVTPKSDTRPETVRYSLRLSADTELGSKIICNMTTINRGDAMVFTNLVELLKARGQIG